MFTSFGILEGIALSISARDTLSDNDWAWFHVVAGQPITQWTLPHLIAFIVLLTISVVLVLHLGLGWFR